MKKYINECVDCPQGCMNCGRKSIEVLACDHCEEVIFDSYYKIDGIVMCEDCIEDFKQYV